MKNVEASLSRMAARQHGVVSRRQALDAGLTARQLDARAASGILRVAHRGIYVPASVPASYEQSVMAACLASGGHASHSCAAVLWRLRGFEDAEVEVTVPYSRAPHRKGVTVHRSRNLDRRDLTKLGRIPITHPARTLLDLASTSPDLVEGALNHALLKGLTRPHLVEAALERAGGRGRAGAIRLRRYLTRADAPTESELEDAFVALVRRHGLPEPVRQHPLAGGEFRLDFTWPAVRHAVEAQGRLWHTSPADRRRDRAKLRQARAEGWTVQCVYWDDVYDAGDEIMAALAAYLLPRQEAA